MDASVLGVSGELILVPMEVENNSKVDGNARVL
jgi:hypothetical protein